MPYSKRFLPCFLTGILIVISLTGCEPPGKRGQNDYGVRDAHNYGSQLLKPGSNSDSGPSGPRAYGSSASDGVSLHEGNKLTYSQVLSDRVGELAGVSAAIVVLTENHAYAAVLIDNTAAGTRGAGSKTETNNSGTSLGRYNAEDFSSYADPRQLATGFNSMHTVEDAEDISHPFRQKIAETLRLNYPAIQEVHVSANRDFINLLSEYVQESSLGYPIDSHANEFNKVANDLFGTP